MQMQMFYFCILLILIRHIYTNYAVKISDRSHLEKCKTTQREKWTRGKRNAKIM